MDNIEKLHVNPDEVSLQADYPIDEIIGLAEESRSAFNDLTEVVLKCINNTNNAPPLRLLSAHVEQQEWLNTYQVAKILNVCNRTIARYRKEKLLPFVVIKGLCKYRYTDVIKLLT